MHMEQSLVGKVLSSCAMWPPIDGSRSMRWTWIPCAAMSRAACMPATPAPTTTTSPMVCILPCKPDIGCGVIEDVLLLGCVSLLDHLSRDTDHNVTFRYISTFAD